jgi:hypothetical protein
MYAGVRAASGDVRAGDGARLPGRGDEMMNLVIFLIVVLPMAWEFRASGELFAQATAAQGQPDSRFLPVQGGSLKARLEAAVQRGRGASPATRFWAAYQFDVRPGAAIDFDSSHGRTMSFDGLTISLNSTAETRNVGVFILHDPGSGAVQRVDLYNLERRRDYSGYPVYWLGRAEAAESIEFLRGLVDAAPSQEMVERAIAAIALHDDQRVGDVLEGFVRNSSAERARKAAVIWLGQVTDRQAFIADVVRNERESMEVRKQAAIAIGIGKGPNVLPTLRSLHGSVTNREVREQVVVAAAIHEGDEDEAVDFLIKVASGDPDREARKQAIFWLGQKAGARSLEALGDAASGAEGDVEVQKHAVFAISQRSSDEAVPLLVEIAKNHPRSEVRKQAIFWLGQSNGDDPRVLELFREILNR